MLTFKASPSYDPEDADGHRVTVQASDGNKVGYFEVTVNVTNVEETGEVTWIVAPPDGNNSLSLLQFQPGAVLTARVTDPDADIVEGDTTWKWYRSSNEIDSTGGDWS